MLQGPLKQAQSGRSENISLRKRLLAWIRLAVAIGAAYFLAARLSLFLQTQPDGVAVFWPAAGISSGILIAFGRDARWPVAVGVIVATIAANLTSAAALWNQAAGKKSRELVHHDRLPV